MAERWARLAAVLAVVTFAAGGVVLLRGGGETGPGAPSAAEGARAEGAATPAAPAELPRGGRQFFPRHRVVAHYGAPQSDALGILGIGTPAQAARRLVKRARAYRRGGRTILPAMELISTIASGAPGRSGRFRNRQPHAVIERYLRAARSVDALLLLDVQPGREDFMRETRRLDRFLREPDVSLALDPEWHVGPGQIPGKVLGSVKASKINEVQRHLSRLVEEEDLPNKLLVVHQFTESMIERRERLRRYPGVELVLNVDGFGGQADKIAKYNLFTRAERRFASGFKLFYEEDTDLIDPRGVLALRPRPDLVVYE